MRISIWFGFVALLSAGFHVNGDWNIDGSTASGWEFVRDLFRDNLIGGHDLGGSVAIYYKGDLVVDLQGGWFDESKIKPYNDNTLQLVFSTSKGLVAVAAALCVQRGLLNYSALVTDYWPEYGQNGKNGTTVAHILSHQAGLPNDSSPIEKLIDWPAMVHSLEERSPLWIPGSKHGYHPLTYGWLAGELVRRVDRQKRSLGQFIREEITNPLEIEFYIGLPSSEEHRVSPLNIRSEGNETINDTEYGRWNDPRLHQAEVPAANGITNARAIARLYASLIGNAEGDKYKRTLNEQIVKLATTSNTPIGDIDVTLNFPTQIAMGFFVLDSAFPALGPGVFGHSGAGGSIGLAVPAKKLSFAYVNNRMNFDATEVDARYKTMLDRIATMINTNGVNLQKQLSFHLLLSCLLLILFPFH